MTPAEKRLREGYPNVDSLEDLRKRIQEDSDAFFKRAKENPDKGFGWLLLGWTEGVKKP